MAVSTATTDVARPPRLSPAEAKYIENRENQKIDLGDVDGESSAEDFSSGSLEQQIDLGSEELVIAPPSKTLAADRPDWTQTEFDLTGDTHHIAVATDLSQTLEQSKRSLDENLVRSSQRYVTMLARSRGFEESPQAIQEIPLLDADYIRANWLQKEFSYDSSLQMPSGEYHQFWTRLEISASQQRIVLNELYDSERVHRLALLGGGLALLVGSVFAVNFGAGFFARRSS